MKGDINKFCPIDGTRCKGCISCIVLQKNIPWPNDWLKEIMGKWPGNETIGELLAALKNKDANLPLAGRRRIKWNIA